MHSRAHSLRGAPKNKTDSVAGHDADGRRPRLYAVRKKQQVTLSTELKKQLEEFAAAVKTRFPELAEKRVALAAGRLVMRLIKPSPARPLGRPDDPAITKALARWEQGEQWRAIAEQVIEGFNTFDIFRQASEKERLQHSVYMRRRSTAQKANKSQ